MELIQGQPSETIPIWRSLLLQPAVHASVKLFLDRVRRPLLSSHFSFQSVARNAMETGLKSFDAKIEKQKENKESE